MTEYSFYNADEMVLNSPLIYSMELHQGAIWPSQEIADIFNCFSVKGAVSR